MENRRMSRNVFPLAIMKDDIVISGIGGRYPESDTLDEFRDNLYNNVDMISGDDRRWPIPVYGMSPRMGKLKEIDKFDASFFGVVPKVADEVDPHARILLETTWEAIVDAGINPQSLRGSNTGVYVGYTSVAMPDGVPQEVQRDVQANKVESLLWFQGASKAFYSNRISFVFDFHGPSMSIDVACASSMVCLDIAVTDMRLGKCDQAIVAGVSINLQPFTNHIYQANNIGAPDGRSKVWDQNANGYVRGETVASIFLQKKGDSKRIYATILHAKTNIDGYKISGMFFPSTDSQLDLMIKTYTEAGVNPLDVNYFEGHGTGTKAGDPQEARAIMEAYCKGRKDRLPVGLLKSNIGHGEGASGVASLSKLCIVYENKKIPANLNMTTLKSEIAEMVPPLEPITKNRDYEPGIVGVNSFGIGGVNAHALLKPNKRECTSNSYQIADQIPRLVNINGRTEEAVSHIFDFIEKNPSRVTREFLALIGETVNYEASIYSAGFPYRGSLLIKQDASKKLSYMKKISKVENAKRPICYFFSGMGSQWSGMAQSLMGIELFANAIQRCADILTRVNIDLRYILLSDDPKALEEKIHHFVAITSMQIALVDVFKALGLEPDYIIGHSFGEIACAYADGCLSLEQAVITSYWRGKAIKDSNVEHGMMAAVGLTWEETVKRCPPGVYAACHNSIDSVTISGAYDKVNAAVEALTADKIFAREVQCANIPFHSPLLNPAVSRMTSALQQVIAQPQARSSKWISTSIAEAEWGSAKASSASPEYFVNNLINPVLFHDASKHIPKDAIIIELAPHALFSAIFKRSMPASSYVGLLKRNNPANLELYLNALGQLYQLGVTLDLKPLYPAVQWPVPRNTQSIGSLVKWDHGKTYFVKKYPEYHCQATASDVVQKFSLASPDDQFLKDHAFDGKCVLPAMSYLLLAWRRLGSTKGLLWYQFPVVFENVEFKRLTPMSENEIKLRVRLLDPTGEFVVLEGENVACTGRIYCPEDKVPFNYQSLVDEFSIEDSVWAGHKLDMNEFYTELNVRGFDYGPKFKQVQQVEYDGFERSRAQVRWDNNWVTFVESMVQLYAAHTTARSIHVALSLPSLKCDPRELWNSTPANVSVVTDATLKCVAAKGIEMKGLKFANIPLKNVMRDVKMEKYEFVPLAEANAIEEVDLREIEQYIEECNLLTDRLAAVQKGTTPVTSTASDKLVAEILHKPLTDSQGLLKLLVALHSRVYDENGNVVDRLSAELVKKAIEQNSINLSQDVLNSVSKNGRLMRSTLDLVNENNLRNLTVIEANYSNSSIVKDLSYHMGFFFHYPLVLEYLLATKDTKALPKEVQNAGYQLVNWETASASTLPTIEAPADLFVYKDSTELDKLNMQVFAQQIADNIKDGGFVFAMFRSQLCKAEAFLNNITGGDLSTLSLRKRITEFEAAAKAANLQMVCKKSDSITSTCILLRKAKKIDPTKQGIVEVKFGYFEDWVDKLKNTFTEYKNKPKNENVWMVADDNSLNGVLGLQNCLQQEPGGDRFRCIFSATKLPRPIDFTKTPYKEILQRDLSMNVFKDNQWGSYRLLNLERDYDKTETNEAYADVAKKGDLNSVKWTELSALESIKSNQTNVKISYAGLDFKDFLLASGSLGTDYVERPVGTEFAGRRADNDKRVMGLACSKAIATSIDTSSKVLLDVPASWSLEDGAASINSLFLVWYSLIDRAQLEEGETILIHPATSATGLLAIQICQRMDCRILATATSDTKRAYLREQCGIPSNCIFDPNEPTFVDDILSITAGVGVDVVLDCMSPERLATTFPIVSNYGRYIEIDNYGATPNAQMRKNTHYYNISSLISEDSFDSIIPKLFKGFSQWFADSSKFIKPVPRSVFRRASIDQAFNALNSKETIGKVLVQIREEESQQVKIKASTKSWFDPNKSYILVGGLGGLGLEVAYWLVTRGAKKLVLVSRSGIKNDYQYVFVKRVATAVKSVDDVQVKISTSDPSSMGGAEKLIAESCQLGPVGGIFHFATVLADAFIEDQTAPAFKKVCAPKMDALGYLDAVTRKCCPQIDYFVAFSSQSSGRGFVGQNNYGYANSVMEHICENRKRDGLPGQAIQYGPIGDVGLWAQNDHIDLTSIGMVINTQRIPSCMEVLDRFLSLPHAIVSTIVREEITQQSAAGASAKNHIWQGIGIDMSSLPDNLTLGDVGMESILAVEMQQRIEREYEVNLTTDEIKQITVGQIKDYQTDNKASIKVKIADFKKSLKK